MKANNNSPAIRYAGFSANWLERQLGEISSSYSGGTPAVAHREYYGGNIPFIRSAEISSDNTALYLTEEGLHSSSAALVDIGCVLYALYGATSGEVSLARMQGAINQAILAIIPQEGYAADFIACWLRKNKFAIINTYLQGGQGNLSAAIVKELRMRIPCLQEQNKIGSFISVIDSHITLHQKKYEKLVNLKKAMLDKMFPKNGELVPEVRFAGFSGNWERWKLAHYLETSYDKNSAGVYSKQDVLSVSGDLGVVNQIEFHGRSFAGVSVMNYGIVQTGDIVYTKSPLRAQPFGIIKTNKGPAGIVSTLYAVYHPKAIVAPDFVQLYFEHDGRLNNYLQPLVNKGAKNDMKISAENALQGLVCFPSLAEQRRIVHSFTALDIVISLHKQRLEILRNLKKAFLEKMFV